MELQTDYEKYMAEYRKLSKEEQQKIRQKAIELLKQSGVPERYINETGIELQIIELLKGGHLNQEHFFQDVLVQKR